MEEEQIKPIPGDLRGILREGFALFPRIARRAWPLYAIMAVIALFGLSSLRLVRGAAYAELAVLGLLAAICVTFLADGAWRGEAATLRSAMQRTTPALAARVLLVCSWILLWLALPIAAGEFAARVTGFQGLRWLGILLGSLCLLSQAAAVTIAVLEDCAPRAALAKARSLMAAGGALSFARRVLRIFGLALAMLALGIVVGFISRGMQEFQLQYKWSRFLWAFDLLAGLGLLMEQLAAVLGYTWYVGFYHSLTAAGPADCKRD